MYRQIGRAAGAVVVALMVVLIIKSQGAPDTASADPSGVTVGKPAAAVQPAQRTSGDSYVRSDTPGVMTALRPCPAAPVSSTNVCGPMDRLPNNTKVTMRCWTDGSAPEGYKSVRWFYVTEVTGPHPGSSGYVYSELVHDQIEVPRCTTKILDTYPFPPGDPPVELSLAQGPPAPAGHWYAITLRQFPPDVDVSVTCYDSVSPDGFKTLELHTDNRGVAFAQRGCYSGDGPDHWVRSEGYDASSNHVTWKATTPTTSTLGESGTSRQRQTVALARGQSAPAGYWYTVTVRGFQPRLDVSVTCYDSVSPGGFKSFTVRVNGAGVASVQRGCYSGDGPDHWARANGVESNHVNWTAPTLPPPSPSPPPPPPARPSPAVTLTKGPVAPFGNRYAISLRNFAANSSIIITCHDSADPQGFYSFSLQTSSSGSASTSNYCYSGDGPDHWARANGVESNHVNW